MKNNEKCTKNHSSTDKCYNNIKNPIKSPIMKDIEKYNEFDCKAIYDITNYLRNKYN